MRTKQTYLTLAASFAAIGLFAEAPPILFQDDFETPEADGAPNLAIWEGESEEASVGGAGDNQWVRVTTENSEQYFGEPNNGYVHIYGDETDSSSHWLVTRNYFEGSSVLSFHFDFHRSASRGDNDPGLRIGKNNPIFGNSSARYLVRFQHNALSNEPVIENDVTYNFQMVYNNTDVAVTYLDGEAVVQPDSYDIWIDGIRVITNGRYGLNTGGVPLGDPITSFAIGVWGDAHADFRMDNLVIYDGAYAVGEPPEDPEPEPEGPIIFADDFSESTSYILDPEFSHPVRHIWNRGPTRVSFEEGRILEVTDRDSEIYFGEVNNPYLRFSHEGMNNQNFHMTAENAFQPTSEVITLSFDFYEPVGVGSSPLEILPGINTSGGSTRIHKLTLNNGEISGVPGLYREGITNNIQVIFNNSAEEVSYLDGALTVPSDTFDLWLNGKLVIQNGTYMRGTLAVGTPLSSAMFIIWGSQVQEIFLDNIVVLDHAHVENPVSIPGPSPVFADDFSEPNGDWPHWETWGGGWPFVESRPNLAVQIRNENSETYFGTAEDNYLQLLHDGSLEQDVSLTGPDVFETPSPVITVFFDFFEPVDFGDTPLRLRLGTGSVLDDGTRIHELTFSNGALAGQPDVYQAGVTNNIQVVMNNSAEDVSYYESHITKTIAPDSYDVWLNGELVLVDHQSNRGGLALDTALASIQFLIRSGANDFLIDNLEVFDYATAQTSELGRVTTFAEWAATHLPEGLRGPGDDAAGDGIANLVKFALGLDPLIPSRNQLPVVNTISENGAEHVSLTFQRFTGAADVTIQVEVSEDLVDWIPLGAEIEVLEVNGGLEQVRVVDPATVAEGSRRFLRLNISQN